VLLRLIETTSGVIRFEGTTSRSQRWGRSSLSAPMRSSSRTRGRARDPRTPIGRQHRRGPADSTGSETPADRRRSVTSRHGHRRVSRSTTIGAPRTSSGRPAARGSGSPVALSPAARHGGCDEPVSALLEVSIRRRPQRAQGLQRGEARADVRSLPNKQECRAHQRRVAVMTWGRCRSRRSTGDVPSRKSIPGDVLGGSDPIRAAPESGSSARRSPVPGQSASGLHLNPRFGQLRAELGRLRNMRE